MRQRSPGHRKRASRAASAGNSRRRVTDDAATLAAEDARQYRLMIDELSAAARAGYLEAGQALLNEARLEELNRQLPNDHPLTIWLRKALSRAADNPTVPVAQLLAPSNAKRRPTWGGFVGRLQVDIYRHVSLAVRSGIQPKVAILEECERLQRAGIVNPKTGRPLTWKCTSTTTSSALKSKRIGELAVTENLPNPVSANYCPALRSSLTMLLEQGE